MQHSFAIIALCYFISGQVSASSRFEEEVKSHLESKGGHGATIVVVQNGQVVYNDAVGADPIDGTLWSPDSVFRVASVSKIILAINAHAVFKDKRVALSTRVSDLSPEIHVSNPYAETDPIRLIHLFEHTSGIHEIIYPWTTGRLNLKERVDAHPDQYVSFFRPGSIPIYSNFNYLLLNHIVETLSGKTFEAEIKRRLFDPLGMTSSGFFLDDVPDSRLAEGYFPNSPIRVGVFDGPYAAAAGMYTTGNDMARFMTALLNGGQAGSTQVLDPAILAALEVPTSSLPARQGLSLGHGPGVVRRQTNGRIYAGHNGMIDGYSARLYYSLERREGYFVAFNTHPIGGPSLSGVGELIEKHFLPQQPSLPLTGSAPSVVDEGFYSFVSPRFWGFGGLQTFTDSGWIKQDGNSLVFETPFGRSEDYVSAGLNLWRRPHEIEASLVTGTYDDADGSKYPSVYKLGNLFFVKESAAWFYLKLGF